MPHLEYVLCWNFFLNFFCIFAIFLNSLNKCSMLMVRPFHLYLQRRFYNLNKWVKIGKIIFETKSFAQALSMILNLYLCFGRDRHMNQFVILTMLSSSFYKSCVLFFCPLCSGPQWLQNVQEFSIRMISVGFNCSIQFA